MLAVLAARHKVPFHVVAPTTTIDVALASGRAIPIEERDATEVSRITPGLREQRNIKIWNPAFDVTPAKLITSFVTDAGIRKPPFTKRSE